VPYLSINKGFLVKNFSKYPLFMGLSFIIMCIILFEVIVSMCYFQFYLKWYMKFVIAVYNSVSVSLVRVRFKSK
jgi:hypothetical protein